MKGKQIFEQAKPLSFSYPTGENHDVPSEGYPYDPFYFIYVQSKVRGFIVRDGLLVGYRVKMMEHSDRIDDVLIGGTVISDYDVDYVHTGDNNGAGYKGDDTEPVTTPLYSMLRYCPDTEC